MGQILFPFPNLPLGFCYDKIIQTLIDWQLVVGVLISAIAFIDLFYFFSDDEVDSDIEAYLYSQLHYSAELNLDSDSGEVKGFGIA